MSGALAAASSNHKAQRRTRVQDSPEKGSVTDASRGHPPTRRVGAVLRDRARVSRVLTMFRECGYLEMHCTRPQSNRGSVQFRFGVVL